MKTKQTEVLVISEETKTSEEQVEYARAVAQMLAEHGSMFSDVHVDDWSDYGDFRIFAGLQGHWTGKPGAAFSYFIPKGEDLQSTPGKHNRRAIRNASILIRKLMKQLAPGVHDLRYDVPKKKLTHLRGGSVFDGYLSDSVRIDIRIRKGADRSKVGLE